MGNPFLEPFIAAAGIGNSRAAKEMRAMGAKRDALEREAAAVRAVPTSLPEEPPGWWIVEARQRIGWARSQGDADEIAAALNAWRAAHPLCVICAETADGLTVEGEGPLCGDCADERNADHGQFGVGA